MTQAAVRRRFRAWQKKLLLGDWKVELKFGPLEHSEKADCDAKPEYREAVVRMDLTKIPDNEIDAYIIHELTHIWTWPIEKQAEHWAGDDESKYETVRDIAEGVVTNLERVILNVSGAKL